MSFKLCVVLLYVLSPLFCLVASIQLMLLHPWLGFSGRFAHVGWIAQSKQSERLLQGGVRISKQGAKRFSACRYPSFNMYNEVNGH